jgi:hypothetical protein
VEALRQIKVNRRATAYGKARAGSERVHVLLPGRHETRTPNAAPRPGGGGAAALAAHHDVSLQDHSQGLGCQHRVSPMAFLGLEAGYHRHGPDDYP